MSSISNSLASRINPQDVTAAAPATPSPVAPSSLTSEQTFLKLLVAQIKNQNPLSPTDSVQFVGQLTQYSELEQLIGIRSGVQQLAATPAATPPAATPANQIPQ